MPQKKRGRGRPPKAPEDLMSVMIPVRVTPREAAGLARAAKKAGVKPLTAWARRALLSAARLQKEVPDVILELEKLKNEMARRLGR